MSTKACIPEAWIPKYKELYGVFALVKHMNESPMPYLSTLTNPPTYCTISVWMRCLRVQSLSGIDHMQHAQPHPVVCRPAVAPSGSTGSWALKERHVFKTLMKQASPERRRPCRLVIGVNHNTALGIRPIDHPLCLWLWSRGREKPVDDYGFHSGLSILYKCHCEVYMLM